jgi:hypothetical protein
MVPLCRRIGIFGLEKNAGQTRVRASQSAKNMFDPPQAESLFFATGKRTRVRHFFHSRCFLCYFLFKKEVGT